MDIFSKLIVSATSYTIIIFYCESLVIQSVISTTNLAPNSSFEYMDNLFTMLNPKPVLCSLPVGCADRRANLLKSLCFSSY